MSVEIFLDCGAPSLYNKLSRLNKKSKTMGSHFKKRKFDDFSYVQTGEYKKYRDEYIKFVIEHQDVLTSYSNLDVINNAELTWENQQILESAGIKPLPVWHFGEDIKWLRMYLEKGYDYICIGGMTPNNPKVLSPALDRIWLNELTDKDGIPLVKIHGFGQTSFELMFRYPWYSVDSKSWVDYSRFGRILVPRTFKGKRDYSKPLKIAVSNRSIKGKNTRVQDHIRCIPAPERKYVMNYLEELGVPIGRSTIKKVQKGYQLTSKKELWHVKGEEVEVIEEIGVCNHIAPRMDVNMMFFVEIEKQLPKWPWSVLNTIEPKKIKGLF